MHESWKSLQELSVVDKLAWLCAISLECNDNIPNLLAPSKPQMEEKKKDRNQHFYKHILEILFRDHTYSSATVGLRTHFPF